MSNKKQKIIGQCRLCLQDKELLQKSHIIPKFLLKKFLNQGSKKFSVMELDTTNAKSVFDNGYEPNILCAECDNKLLGSYEDYGSKFLFGPLGKKDTIDYIWHEMDLWVENVNYQKLKMFILSLLWKYSISNVFTSFVLDSKTEEILRKTLHNNEYLDEFQFPILLGNYAHLKEIPQEFIPPALINKNDQDERQFRFIGGGIFIEISLNYNSLSELYKDAMLKEPGSIKIVALSIESARNLINNAVGWYFLK